MTTKAEKIYTREELRQLEVQRAIQLNLSIKNIKTFSGHDGMVGINVDIYYNNKKFAKGYDDAYGGGMTFPTTGKTDVEHMKNRTILKSIEKQISRLPIVLYQLYKSNPEPYENHNSLEGLIDALVNVELERKELARDAKKGVVYEDKDSSNTYILNWKHQLPKFFKLYPTEALKIVQKGYDRVVSEGHIVKNVEFLKEYGINV